MSNGTSNVEKFEAVLDSVLQQLQTSDQAILATTCAALAMLIAQAPHGVQQMSGRVLPDAVRLLQVEQPLVQQNACALLMTLAEVQSQELSSNIQAWSNAVDWISSQLASMTAAGDLKINCAEALGAIASASQEGADLLQKHGNAALISALSDNSVTVQEATTDALCKIATSEQSRAHLVEKGALEGLARALQSNSPEVQVRSLLALGMLVGGNAEWQGQLAGVEGALPRLLALRLQHDDEDSRSIADGIVGALLKNPGCKQQLSDAFRAQQADEQQNAGQYV